MLWHRSLWKFCSTEIGGFSARSEAGRAVDPGLSSSSLGGGGGCLSLGSGGFALPVAVGEGGGASARLSVGDDGVGVCVGTESGGDSGVLVDVGSLFDQVRWI